MAKNVKKSFRFAPVIAAATTLLVGGAAWFSTNAKTFIQVPSYEVTQVFDGDTFETKEKQYIRVSGIDAPEIGRCGSKEAKLALERLVLGKKLYIKILYHIGSRQMGQVYTESGSVSEAMLKAGWAIKIDKEGVKNPDDQKATDYARQQRLGIFSPLCTQTTNLQKPNCTIKGNIVGGEQKTYHLKECPSYEMTTLQLYVGDQWFCSEHDALSAGFKKAQSCRN